MALLIGLDGANLEMSDNGPIPTARATASDQKLAAAAPAGRKSGPSRQRGSHVDSNPAVRAKKADKVTRVIQRLLGSRPRGWALDVGCGAGYIAQRLDALGWNTAAIDVADYRTVPTRDLIRARAESLPFLSARFSVVVSNHVIEHVNDASAHLAEVRRVLAPGGVAYVATPNRLWILEPHYKLPLLSWLPRRFADVYVRALRRGSFFDVFPLTRGGLVRLSAEAGLQWQDITAWVISETGQVERSWPARLLGSLPQRLLSCLSWASPTVVFAMRPGHYGQDDAQG